MTDKIVENLLNQMYKEPDLKADIFSFIQPYITKAYSLLQQDKLSKDSLGQSVLTDLDQKHMIETIIYRDLPSLIDVYTKLPLEYRNEHTLKDGKTHRSLLIENIEILAKKLKSLEHAAYESINQALTVKNRLIKEKYGDDHNYIQLNSNEIENEVETLESTYNWDIEKTKILKSDKTIFEKNISPSKKGFVIKNGQIQKTLGSKIKNLYKKTALYLSNKLKEPEMKKNLEVIENFLNEALAWIIVGAVITSPFSIGGGWIYYDISQNSGARHIAKSYEILSVNKELKEVSLKTLSNYAAENDLKVKFEPEKQQVLVMQNLDSGKCERVFEYLGRHYSKEDYKFNVNGADYSSKMKIAEENVETICNYESNKIVNTVPYL